MPGLAGQGTPEVAYPMGGWVHQRNCQNGRARCIAEAALKVVPASAKYDVRLGSARHQLYQHSYDGCPGMARRLAEIERVSAAAINGIPVIPTPAARPFPSPLAGWVSWADTRVCLLILINKNFKIFFLAVFWSVELGAPHQHFPFQLWSLLGGYHLKIGTSEGTF